MSILMPKGFRFHPKDYELVSYYLHSKVNGEESEIPPPSYRMPEVDVYGEEPWEIWERFGQQDEESLYFFATTKKLNVNGKRIDRRTNSRLGTWSEGERSKPVHDEKGNPIGSKRKFRYESAHSLHHAAWQLEEYSSNFSPHWVVCHLRKNKRSCKSNKRKHTLCQDAPSRSTRMKCIKPKNKSLRRVHHQEVVENTLINNKDQPSNSTEMKYNMPENKRLRKVGNQVVENTLMYMASNTYPFEKDLPQTSTTTSSNNLIDQYVSITTNLDFVTDYDHSDFTPINNVKGVDNLSMPGNNNYYEDGLQLSSATISSANNNHQQFNIGESLQYSTADHGNFMPISDVKAVDTNYWEDNYYYQSSTATISSCTQKTNVATNLDFDAGHDHGNVIPMNDAKGIDSDCLDVNLLNLVADDNEQWQLWEW